MFRRALQLCWSKGKEKQSWEILKGSAIILAHIIIIIRRRKRRRRTRGERGCRRLLENWWRARLCKLDPEMNKWPSPPSPPPSPPPPPSSSPSPSSPSSWSSSSLPDGKTTWLVLSPWLWRDLMAFSSFFVPSKRGPPQFKDRRAITLLSLISYLWLL